MENRPCHLLYDRELGAWIDGLRCGGLVLVVDACYCGAITKNVLGSEGLFPRGFFLPAPRGSKSVRWKRGEPTPLNTGRANTLVIEAAQIDQQAWEDRETGNGLLTRRMLELFDRGLPAPVLFQDVEGWVKSEAAKGRKTQVPVKVDTMGSAQFVPFAEN